jgi:phosphoribosylanthranilate isomerase
MMVKICGITNREDALAAVEGGAAALGLNFWPRSPRAITIEQAADLVAALPAGIIKAGVFVNQPEAGDIARRLNLDVVQFCGDETPADYPAGLRVWKSVRVGENFTLPDCPAEALLLDGPAGALHGGSGKTFDWRLAAGAARKIILAGGLDASNVREAIAAARPWGVDACSRLESSPGKKDHVKMAAFLKAALAAL